MSFIPVKPVSEIQAMQPLSESSRERRILRVPKATDSKVKGLVLERNGLPAVHGALLPSQLPPRAVIELLASFAVPALEEIRQRQLQLFHSARASTKSRKRPKLPIGKIFPVGLRYDENGWINALNSLMQLIVFIPSLSEIFHFAPRTFHPFLDFLDQYRFDAQENRLVSSANTHALLALLRRKLPAQLFRSAPNLSEILQPLLQAIFPSMKDCFKMVRWVRDRPLETLFEHRSGDNGEQMFGHTQMDSSAELPFQKTLSEEIMVAVNANQQDLQAQRQMILFSNCYDLDAFVELRPDESFTHYVTYLKLEGSWYQCDDDRVTLLRSNRLSTPLQYATLLHYRRIHLTR